MPLGTNRHTYSGLEQLLKGSMALAGTVLLENEPNILRLKASPPAATNRLHDDYCRISDSNKAYRTGLVHIKS